MSKVIKTPVKLEEGDAVIVGWFGDEIKIMRVMRQGKMLYQRQIFGGLTGFGSPFFYNEINFPVKLMFDGP